MKRLSLPVSVVVVAVVALAVILTASPALAGVKWTENGELLRGFSFLDPQKPVVAPMSDGGAVIAWENLSGGSLYAVRLDADGNEMWYQPVREIAGRVATNPQIAVVFEDDSIVVTWQDNRNGNWDIYAQRMLPDGSLAWPENGVEVRRLPGSDAINPQMVGGTWGPTITWQDYRNGQSDLYAQQLGMDGNAPWIANGVEVRRVAGSNATNAKIASDDEANVILTWTDARNVDLGIYAQRVDVYGTPTWTANGIEVRVMAGTSADFPQIEPDGEKGAIITWQDNRNVPTGGNVDVYAQRIYPTGGVWWTANGVPVRVMTGSDSRSPVIATGDTSEAVISWQDMRNGVWDIYAQKLDGDGGSPMWDLDGVPVREIAGSDTLPPIIATDGQGGAVIAWQDERNVNKDIYTQRIDTDGAPLWTPTEGVPVRVVAGSDTADPYMAPDGYGGGIIAWHDARDSESRLYAQRAVNDAPSVTGVDPDHGFSDGVTSVTVTGDWFYPGARVWLSMDGQPDIDATNVNVASLNQLTCDIYPGWAQIGTWKLHVTNTDGQTSSEDVDFEIEYAPPLVNSINPSLGNQGQIIHNMVVEGGHFREVSTTIELRKGAEKIEATDFTIINADYIWADFAIPDDATLGSWDFYIRYNDDMKDFTLHDAFTMRKPQIDTVTPSQGYADITYSVSISGTNTNWTMTPLEVDAGDGITVSNIAAGDDRHLTADFTISKYPTPGPKDVTVTAGSVPQQVTLGGGFTVIPPSIAGCEPTSVVQGHTANIDIVGDHTHFKNGTSYAEFFGTGITVNSTDVTDATNATANITVAVDAFVGYQDINVITGREVPKPLRGVFTVIKAPSGPPHIDSVNPDSGTVGTHVTLSGEHFGKSQGQSYVTFNGAKVNWYHSWADGTVVCQVPSGATTGPVTVTTPAGTSNGIDFTVTKPHVPRITDVSPNAIHQGDSGVGITITGEYTHFKQGQSVATFSGTGITVNSITVGDSTHASANITVAIDAPTGTRDVNVVTGSETPAPLVGHFTVQPHGTLPPRLDGISPGEGLVGNQVTLSGGNFGTDRGSSQVTFYDSVAATEYVSWADDKILCKVPAGATTGPVTVTTYTGTSGGKKFTVGESRIKDCEPRVVHQGHEVELSVLGEHTHFVNGKSMMVVSGKNGVKVGSTYASDATHASATVTVADDATPGTRDVNVVTGSEHPAALSNVLTIKKKPDSPPAISALHPAEGPVGTRVSVVGENFGDARGSSTVTFNGTPVTNYASWSGHDIVCNVPLGAATGEVKVHTPWGTSEGTGFTVDDFTFYFAEGTCRPGFAPYLTIQNPDPSDAQVKITYMLGDGTTSEQDLTIPATTRATVTVTDTLGVGDDPAHDFSCKVECTNSQAIVAERPMYFSYGPGWTGGSDVIGALSPSESFYFAEGTCRPGFAPYLTIQNPASTEAEVKITYMLGDGTTQEQDITVPATTRSTVTVTDVLGVGDDTAHDFSCRVESTNEVDIVAERPMYFSYGAPAGLAWTGGSDVVGALSPAEEFYFAEGTCRPGFSPYLTIQNPAGTEAQVVITYMRGDGSNQEQSITVPATSRSTVTVTDVLGSGDSPVYDFSATVKSTNNVDIIAERPMYFNYQGVWTGGSDVVGALSPAGAFYFAEGTCRPGFAPYLTIQNPGLAHASVKITYMKGDGTTQEQDVTVGARSRYTVFVPDTLGVGEDTAHDFSCMVQCTNDKEIIAERPMYFNYQGEWTGGSDVVGFSP